jgi:hypothetical protein
MVTSQMEAKNGSGKVAVEALNAGGKATENQPAPRSAEPPLSPSDVPAQAPSQLNESASGLAGTSGETAAAASTETNKSDDAKNASSSQKPKKKHHFHIPIPF